MNKKHSELLPIAFLFFIPGVFQGLLLFILCIGDDNSRAICHNSEILNFIVKIGPMTSVIGGVLLLLYFFLNRKSTTEENKGVLTRDIGPWVIAAVLAVLIYKLLF